MLAPSYGRILLGSKTLRKILRDRIIKVFLIDVIYKAFTFLLQLGTIFRAPVIIFNYVLLGEINPYNTYLSVQKHVIEKLCMWLLPLFDSHNIA